MKYSIFCPKCKYTDRFKEPMQVCPNCRSNEVISMPRGGKRIYIFACISSLRRMQSAKGLFDSLSSKLNGVIVYSGYGRINKTTEAFLKELKKKT